MLRPTIGLDWDDVIAPFNSIACELYNEELDECGRKDEFVTIQDIDSWNTTGKASGTKKYFRSQELYKRQTERIPEETISAVRALMKIADVYFISAAYPEFMSLRAAQIQTVFPEVSTNQIILGAAKDLVQLDFILDDNVSNVLNSPARYPVLFRKPWNNDMTGLLAVNTLQEFVCFVQTIVLPKPYEEDIHIPSIIALVGPSGSGKNKVAEDLTFMDDRFVRPLGYTTKRGDSHRLWLSEVDFQKKDFLEKTRYAGYAYGIEREEVLSLLDNGKFPVIPIDICGAIGMKLHFPTVMVYLRKNKYALVADVISDNQLSEKEKALRIMAMDAECKNETICDYSMESDSAVEQILGLIKTTEASCA